MGYAGTGSPPSGQPARPVYQPDESIRNHILFINPKGSVHNGIKGGHDREAFLRDAQGIQIVSEKPYPGLDGYTIIDYLMPERDNANQIIPGSYRRKVFTKTVYDPSVISIEEYLRRGYQAVNEAAARSPDGILPEAWHGVDAEGIKWTGSFKNGRITSLYPENPK